MLWVCSTSINIPIDYNNSQLIPKAFRAVLIKHFTIDLASTNFPSIPICRNVKISKIIKSFSNSIKTSRFMSKKWNSNPWHAYLRYIIRHILIHISILIIGTTKCSKFVQVNHKVSVIWIKSKNTNFTIC